MRFSECIPALHDLWPPRGTVEKDLHAELRGERRYSEIEVPTSRWITEAVADSRIYTHAKVDASNSEGGIDPH